MDEKVYQNLIRLGVKPGNTVGIAVSGGPDSIALLHCLYFLKDRLGVRIVALHMEHGIRGESSRSDMRFVMHECEKLGVPCYVKIADVPAIAKENGVSVESAARMARYEFLGSCEADYIATAHHMDDMAETVIMNLVRGSGLSGLTGIPEKRGKYIRPMLDISRSEIEKYIKQNAIRFVLDETNGDPAYTRNFVRCEILPRMRRINESAAQNIARTARLLCEDEEALTAAAESSGGIEYSEIEAVIDLKNFAALKTAVKKRALRLAVSHVRPMEDFEYVHAQNVLDLAEKGVSGKRIDIGDNAFALIEYGKLVIGKDTPKSYNKKSVVLREGTVEFGKFTFECSSFDGIPEFSKGVEFFNTSAVDGSVFRIREDGDRITPLGMTGTKLLGDYLSDRKVPTRQRDALVVLAKDSEVYWAVGIGVSEKSKAEPGNRLLRIRYWENINA